MLNSAFGILVFFSLYKRKNKKKKLVHSWLVGTFFLFVLTDRSALAPAWFTITLRRLLCKQAPGDTTLLTHQQHERWWYITTRLRALLYVKQTQGLAGSQVIVWRRHALLKYNLSHFLTSLFSHTHIPSCAMTQRKKGKKTVTASLATMAHWDTTVSVWLRYQTVLDNMFDS